MPRFFTVDQARGLLPRVKVWIEQAVQSKAQYQICEQWNNEFQTRVLMLGGMVTDRAPFIRNREIKNSSAETLKSAVEQIHGHGVLVKDLDMGLIDFPTLLHDTEVYICWKLGEDDLEYWHGVEEGFAGRKMIDGEFLQNHRGRAAD